MWIPWYRAGRERGVPWNVVPWQRVDERCRVPWTAANIYGRRRPPASTRQCFQNRVLPFHPCQDLDLLLGLSAERYVVVGAWPRTLKGYAASPPRPHRGHSYSSLLLDISRTTLTA